MVLYLSSAIILLLKTSGSEGTGHTSNTHSWVSKALPNCCSCWYLSITSPSMWPWNLLIGSSIISHPCTIYIHLSGKPDNHSAPRNWFPARPASFRADSSAKSSSTESWLFRAILGPLNAVLHVATGQQESWTKSFCGIQIGFLVDFIIPTSNCGCKKLSFTRFIPCFVVFLYCRPRVISASMYLSRNNEARADLSKDVAR